VITDKYPVALHYVAHLDQLWVLNWRSVYDDGVKTIQVIRDASQKRKHHTVHPEPIDGQFDLVRDLFMPTAQVCAINVVIIYNHTQCRLTVLSIIRNVAGPESLVQVRLRESRQPKRTLQTRFGQHAVHKKYRPVTVQLRTPHPAIFVLV